MSCTSMIILTLSMFSLSSTYNYMGKLFDRMLMAVHRSKMEAACQEQRRAQAAIRLLQKYGKIIALHPHGYSDLTQLMYTYVGCQGGSA